MRNKQIAGGVILSMLSQVITIIVGLAYTPIMIRLLGQNEYGLYQLVQSVVDYLNLMNFGFSGAYIRYYSIAKAKNDEKEVANINGMFMNVFLFIGILCLLAGAVLLLNINILGAQLTDSDYAIARKLLIIMVINLSLSFPNSFFVVFMSAKEEFIFQKAVNIAINILIPILNLPILLMGGGSVGIVAVTLLLTILRFIVNAWFCIIKLKLKMRLGYFNKKIFSGLLGYTFFIFLSDLVDQLNSNVDKLLLGRIMGTIAVAIYSVGFNLKNYYTILTWIVPEMYIPEVNKMAIENNERRLTEIFTFIGRINNYLVLLIISGFAIFGRYFIYLWTGPEYHLSYYVTFILMITGYIPAVQTIGVNIQNAKNMHRMRSIVYFIVACVNVILSIFLIKYWGVIGTCLGTLIATIMGHGIFMNYYYKKYLKLDIAFFWKSLSRWYPFAGAAILLSYLVIKNFVITTWSGLIIGMSLYLVLYILLLMFFGLTAEERILVVNKLKRR